MAIGSLVIKRKAFDPPPSLLIPNPQGKIAIVDGDVLCYHACPPRTPKVFVDEGVQLVRLDDNGFVRSGPEFTEEEEAEYTEQAWANLKRTLSQIAEELWCDDALVAVADGPSFRHDMFPEYKVHRHRNGAPKNETVPELRRRCIASGLAVGATGYEADDMIRWWAEQARAIGQEYIICSVDKDLLCIPGEHYRMHKGKEATIYVSDHEAAIHYHEQLIKGDSTDNIPGVPGMGPKRATAALSGCSTVAEMRQVVVDAYYKYYGPEWANALAINGKLIHIMASPTDYFTLDGWPEPS